MGISRKTKFLDQLHRRSVQTIWIFSGISLGCLVYTMYRFFTVVTPKLKENRRIYEQELLAEGKALDEDLSASQ